MLYPLVGGISTALALLYLIGLLTYAAVSGMCVLTDMRGKWPKLQWWQWAIVPLIFTYYALRTNLCWPYYFWLEEQRNRKVARHTRLLLREMGIR